MSRAIQSPSALRGRELINGCATGGCDAISCLPGRLVFTSYRRFPNESGRCIWPKCLSVNQSSLGSKLHSMRHTHEWKGEPSA